MSAIEFNKVWEKYRIKFICGGKVSWEELWVLEDINLRVAEGEVVGVIGQNGAGKTTLLKLIAGMLMADRGTVKINGRVSVLMELGAGFNAEFTGRENILLNARMYGLDEKSIEQQCQRIIEFAGLGRFIDAPVKYYSQGMYMRLAFALAIFVEPDILLIDDILSVGDEEAKQKCIRKILELKEAGKTIVLVSHDMHMIARLCDRVLMLDKGAVAYEGAPEEVISRYLETVGNRKGVAVLENGGLKLVCNNGRINLSYGGRPITKITGGYVAFLSQKLDVWSSSLMLDWQIRQVTAQEIVAEGLNGEGEKAQVWRLSLGDKKLQWQVEVLDEGMKNTRIDLFCTADYARWISIKKEGVFPAFVHKIHWQEVSDGPCQVPVVAMETSDAAPVPDFIMTAKGQGVFIRVYNSGDEQAARIVQSCWGPGLLTLELVLFPEKVNLRERMCAITSDSAANNHV